MEKEIIGVASGLLVILSGVPYAVRTYQGKIKPNLTSWSLWSFIGLAILLTYESSGASHNVWPAVFGFLSPFIITILVIRQGKWKRFNKVDKISFFFGVSALVMWVIMKEERLLVQYALYTAILADLCAAVPTMFFVWKNPSDDRPFAWTLYAFGYGLAIFAIEAHTFSNYILPLYMFFGAMFIALPLLLYRWKERTPIRDWV
ncbi:MAG: hypothetical protein WD607_05055 [Candidatus Paceibacterota bacterium]